MFSIVSMWSYLYDNVWRVYIYICIYIDIMIYYIISGLIVDQNKFSPQANLVFIEILIEHVGHLISTIQTMFFSSSFNRGHPKKRDPYGADRGCRSIPMESRRSTYFLSYSNCPKS